MTLERRSVLLVFTFFLIHAAAASAQSDNVLRGVVRDPTGGVVHDAEVQVLGARQQLIGVTRTDSQGRFSLAVPQAGNYLIVVRAARFGETRSGARAPGDAGKGVELTRGAPELREEISVTAGIDQPEPTTRLTQPVNIIDESEIALRAKSVVVQAANEEVGLHVQRTSPVMAGVFVRGLTGNKVNVFVEVCAIRRPHSAAASTRSWI
jgi:hypothetical protein